MQIHKGFQRTDIRAPQDRRYEIASGREKGSRRKKLNRSSQPKNFSMKPRVWLAATAVIGWL
jgi:hypothetical protein